MHMYMVVWADCKKKNKKIGMNNIYLSLTKNRNYIFNLNKYFYHFFFLSLGYTEFIFES
jgi:hypothetical protein